MEPWRKNLIVVWFANFVTAFGLMAILPFFPFHLRALGLTDPEEIKIWAGLCVGAAPIMAGIFGSFWGTLGDRMGRKLMVVRAQGAVGLFIGLMAFSWEPWHLVLFRLLQGTFSGYLAPSMTLVSVLAPPGKQGAVGGRITSAMVAGGVVGPIVGGEMMARGIGLAGISFLCAATSLLGVVLVMLFATEPPLEKKEGRRNTLGSVLAQTARDLRAAFHIPGMRTLIVVLFLARLASSSVEPTLVVFVEELMKETSEATVKIASWVFDAGPLAQLIFLPFWGKLADRKGPGRILFWCTCGAGVFTVLQSFVTTPLQLGVLRFFWGALVSGIFPAAFALFAGTSSKENRGMALGMAFSVFTFALAFGMTAGGFASAWVGHPALFLGAGIILLLGSIPMRKMRIGQVWKEAREEN